MKPHILFLLPLIMYCTGGYAATACSRANLTRCLDSACALNISSNPSARCQYCGTASAGTPPTSRMRSVSVGTSTTYNISEQELKNAPTDPGERYAWATKQCIKKISSCTTDDVSEIYDPLIEQSCKAAGISAQMKTLQQSAKKTKTKSSCESEIRACIIDNTRCMADFRECESDTIFDKNFSECGVINTGCDEYISEIRDAIISDKRAAIKNADENLAKIVSAYKNARTQRINYIKTGCNGNTKREQCVETVCANNMPNKCGLDHPSEKSAAMQLCKFYDTACATID